MPSPTSRPSSDISTAHSIDPDGGTANLYAEIAHQPHDLNEYVRSYDDVYRPPNVVLVLTDDEKFAEVQDGFLRDGTNGGPSFKAMMRDVGTIFPKFQVVRSVCSPSRATFVSGQYSQSTTVWSVGAWNQFHKNALVFRWLWSGGARLEGNPTVANVVIWCPATLHVDNIEAFDPAGGEFAIMDFSADPDDDQLLGTYTGVSGTTLTGCVAITPTSPQRFFYNGASIFPVGTDGARKVQTGIIGKINNDYGDGPVNGPPVYPTPPGFDHWRVFNNNYAFQYNWQAREEDYNADGTLASGAYFTPDGSYYITDYCADRARDLIELFTQRDPSDPRYGLPFFLQVCPTNPHGGSGSPPVDQTHRQPPISGDPTHRAARMAAYNTWLPPFFDTTNGTAYPNIPGVDATGHGSITDSHYAGSLATERGRMQGLVACDDLLGTIIDALTAAGVLDNTIIVYTSDNGWANGENADWSGKDSTYDAVMKVPFVMRGPGIQAGHTNNGRVANVDWCRTLSAILQVEPAIPQDGLDFWQVIEDEHAFDDRVLYLNAGPQTSGRQYSNGYAGVMTKRWKYCTMVGGHAPDPNSPPVLFDLLNDPWEMTNLYGNPTYAAVQGQLDTLLQQMRVCSGDACDLTYQG